VITPPPLPARELRVALWPNLLVALLLGMLLGAALAGWMYERAIAGMKVDVARALLIHAQATETITTLNGVARATLAACEDAMPATVAEQRREMLEEIQRSLKKPPKGIGGP